MTGTTDPARLRLVLYTLLATVAIGQAAGRILSTQRVYEPDLFRDEKAAGDRRTKWPVTRPAAMPTFGSNDRSRWATVRSLVDGWESDDKKVVKAAPTFVIGQRDRATMVPEAVALLGVHDPITTVALAEFSYSLRLKSDTGVIFEDGWQSVDKVLKPDTYEFYSSKPPLLSVLMAGLYWLLQQLFGWTLAASPDLVVRTSLLLVNVLPFALYLALLARLLERYSSCDWSKIVVFTAACFATVLTPFHITFNNHTIATYCVLFALYATLQILEGGKRPNPPTPWAGEPAALAAGLSHPAAYAAGSPAQEGQADWWHYLVAGLCAGFVVVNELPALAFAAGLGLVLLLHRPLRTLGLFVPAVAVPLLALVALNYVALGQLRPAYSEFGSEWYQYEGSHWRNPTRRTGIDFARNVESLPMYAVHVLVGHHGLFALTPLWLLAFFGMAQGTFAWLRRAVPSRSGSVGQDSNPANGPGRIGILPHSNGSADLPLWLQPATLLLSIVVIGFYLFKSDNYGGWTNGLRWLMWLTPLWLLCLLPILQRLGTSRWGRGLVYVLLGLSVVSVSFAPWNPWRHPYLYDWMERWGWIAY